MISVGCELFAESWGLFTAASTLLWHAKAKVAQRIGEVHRWGQRHHCELPRRRLACATAPWVGCGGAVWRRCAWEHDHGGGAANASSRGGGGGGGGNVSCTPRLVNLLKRRVAPPRTNACKTQAPAGIDGAANAIARDRESRADPADYERAISSVWQ